MSLVEVTNLFKNFKQLEVLHNVSLTLEAGEFVLICGKSGSGKSTLLNCIAGLENFEKGDLKVDGRSLQDITQEQRADLRLQSMGIVFQFFNLLPALTVLQNVALPAMLAGKGASESNRLAEKLLDDVGISHLQNKKPTHISGGESQRAAIARALLLSPRLILADEPTGNLDQENGEIVMGLFKDIATERKSAVLLVSHEPSHSVLADSCYRITDGKLTEYEAS